MQPLQPVSGSDLQRFLSAPDQLLQQSVALQLAVASFPDTPHSLLEILVNSPDAQVAEAASLHVNFAGEITDGWQEIVDALLQQRQLGQNDRLAVELLKLGTVPPCFLSEWVPPEQLIPGLRNPHMPLKYRLQLLERLAQEPTLEPRLQVAESPETPFAVLEQFAGDLELPVRLAVKFNPSCPPPLIELVEGQYAVASDWNTDAEQLTMLGGSRWGWIRQAVAQNPNTPPDVLVKLASDSRARIHLDVARNPSSPVAALALLVNHFNHAVRQSVAKHSHTSEELLLQILPNCSVEIAQRANLPAIVIEQLVDIRRDLLYLLDEQANITGEILAKILNITTGWEKRIAKNPQVLVSTLEQLGNHSDSWVCLEVARNLKTPYSLREQILADLAALEQIAIRAEVAAYQNTPKVLLELLGESELCVAKKDCSVAIALLSNPSTPALIRERLKQYFLLPPDRKGHYQDGEFRMALVLNPEVPEVERNDYLQQIFQLYGEQKTLEKLAKNHKTPLDLLEKLAKSSDNIIRNYVAKNPSTPVEILIQLTEDDDRQVRECALQNPHVPILEAHRQIQLGVYQLLLAQTEAEETKNTHQLMARRTDSPYALAQVVEKGDLNSKLIAARSNKTPIQVLQQLAKDPDENVRLAVVQNPNTPPNSLLELARDPSYKVRIWLSRSRHPIPKDVLSQLIQSSDARIRAEIANNSNTPPDILREFVEDSDRNVKISALQNPNLPSELLSQVMSQIQNEREIEQILRGQAGTGKRNSQMPADVLEQLSRHPKDTIRYLVATYRTASTATLERLAFDKYELVRKTVAENPNTPPNILIEMARCDELTTNVGCYHSVSNKIAMRHDAPAEALEFIARKSVSPVRVVVAANANTPSSALKWLAENEVDESVLCVLVRHQNMTLNIWMELARHESVRVRKAVASQTNCPSEVLRILVDDSSPEVQQKVAANSNTPIHIVERFFQNDNPAIRTAVASNPHLPETILTQLATDEKVEVRRAVAQNPNTPAPIRETLRDLIVQPTTRQTSPTLRGLNRLYNPSTDDLVSILAEYASSENAFVRLVTLLHPLTPDEVLTQAAQSASWLERYAVADNSGTPSVLRQQLAEDSNRIVRAAARVNTNS